MIQWMLAIWSLVPLPFLNPAWTSGSSWFMYCWSLAWRILSITLLACEMSVIVWTFFGITFLWDWNEKWPFPVLWPLLSFPNLLTYADGDCGHEIKRCLLLWRKVMTNPDSLLKSRNITLSTKVHLVKAMVFPVVMYGFESWTIKLSAEELMLLNCGVGEDSCKSLGLQGDPTSPS